MTRKFKLPPNFFSKIYHSINISPETLNLPNSEDLKLFGQRTKNAMEEVEDLKDSSKNDNFFDLEEKEEDAFLNQNPSPPKHKVHFLELFSLKLLFLFFVEIKQLNNNSKKKSSEYKRENSLMDVVDFIFLLAKTENKTGSSMQNFGRDSKKPEGFYNYENEENNSLSTTEKSNYFSENDNNFQEKFLENLLNEKNINYSNLINKILLPISKRIIGLIGDFTVAYSRLKEMIRKKELAEKKKAFSMKNIIISPPIKEHNNN